MKSFLKILFLLLFSISFAQNVSDFGTIYVPENFKTESMNKYDLRNALVAGLKKKGYQISNDENFGKSDCNLVFAELLNTSSFLRNKLKIEFRDCNKNVLANYEGISTEKDFEIGYADALEKALEKVPASKPTNNLAIKKLEPEKQEMPINAPKVTRKK